MTASVGELTAADRETGARRPDKHGLIKLLKFT